VVPRLALEGVREVSQLMTPRWRRLHQRQLPPFAEYHQQIPRQQYLPVAVTLAPPFPFAGLRVQAHQRSLTQPVEVSLVRDRIVKLAGQAFVLPQRLHRPLAFCLGDLQHGTPDAVTRRDEDAVAVQDERLRDVDTLLCDPRVAP